MCSRSRITDNKDERRPAPDEGSGYLWRFVSFARFEERDGGLYLELEVIGLSKDLPGSLRLLLKPVIDHVPRQLLNAKFTKLVRPSGLGRPKGPALYCLLLVKKARRELGKSG